MAHSKSFWSTTKKKTNPHAGVPDAHRAESHTTPTTGKAGRLGGRSIPRHQSSIINMKSAAARYKQIQRLKARKNGFCANCCKKPAKIGRVTCADCLMRISIQNLFKHQQGPASVHGSCFVKGYSRAWIDQVVNAFNGRCFYTNAQIQIGGEETATVALDIPRHLIPVYGEAKVLNPENVVWVHAAVGRFKGNLCRSDFLTLWHDLHVSTLMST